MSVVLGLRRGMASRLGGVGEEPMDRKIKGFAVYMLHCLCFSPVSFPNMRPGIWCVMTYTY